MNQWNALKKDFLGTIGAWQDRRTIWIVGGIVALLSELFAVYFFQEFLKLEPCELCVYIRFSMLIILLGAIIGALLPKNLLFKIIGYAIVIYGIIKGILWSLDLRKTILQTQEQTGFISSCSVSEVRYPFGIPLDHWFPQHFFPTAICGEDTWQLWGLNMPEYMLIIYAVFSVFILLMILGWIYNLFFKKHCS